MTPTDIDKGRRLVRYYAHAVEAVEAFRAASLPVGWVNQGADRAGKALAEWVREHAEELFAEMEMVTT